MPQLVEIFLEFFGSSNEDHWFETTKQFFYLLFQFKDIVQYYKDELLVLTMMGLFNLDISYPLAVIAAVERVPVMKTAC